jgi:hypothetical protein
MTEYVYCFSNDSMKEIYKIGKTTRDINQRLKEANVCNTWSPPTPFKLEFFIEVENSSLIEKLIHKKLDKYRCNKKKEFFKLQLEDIKKCFNEVEEIKESKCLNTTNTTNTTKVDKLNKLDKIFIEFINESMEYCEEDFVYISTAKIYFEFFVLKNYSKEKEILTENYYKLFKNYSKENKNSDIIPNMKPKSMLPKTPDELREAIEHYTLINVQSLPDKRLKLSEIVDRQNEYFYRKAGEKNKEIVTMSIQIYDYSNSILSTLRPYFFTNELQNILDRYFINRGFYILKMLQKYSV